MQVFKEFIIFLQYFRVNITHSLTDSEDQSNIKTMDNEKDYIASFDEYIRQGEPSKRESAANWQTAIGLQAVDGLQPSTYLLEVAGRNIEGEITLE